MASLWRGAHSRQGARSPMVGIPVKSGSPDDDARLLERPGTFLADVTRTSEPEPATPKLAPADVDLGSVPQLRDPARYRILGEHGRGGLGRVSRAHDRELGRDIAIMELLARGDLSEVRFLREALITARLEHPGIVPVHEAGRWPDGTPFYAMKLVSGRSLRDLIAERTTVDARIALLHHVIAVADAIAYAHDRHIIHRDLKPANVIVGEFGETIVIDWGLAKDLSASEDSGDRGSVPRPHRDDDLTAAGSVLGTPAYMAPEQERGEPVDQRADVFAIGAMLWELCALQKVPPADPELRHRILRTAGIDRDLATIVDKALAPDPARRYPHAGALAADLKAFKSGARIAARSYSLPALLARWIRRHRALSVSIVAAVALTATAGGLHFHEVAAERDRADDAKQLAESRLTLAYVERGRLALLDGNLTESAIVLGHAVARGSSTPAIDFMVARATQPLLREQLHLTSTKGRILWAAFSPDGRQIAATDEAGALVWAADTGKLLFTLPHGDTTYQGEYSADGAQLATASADGTVKLWDTATGAPIRVLRAAQPGPRPLRYHGIAVAPDGRWIAAVARSDSLHDAVANVWDGRTGAAIAQFLIPAERACIPSITHSRDGEWLAVSGGDDVEVFDTRRWKLGRRFAGPGTRSFQFDRAGRNLAVARNDGDVSIWDLASGDRVAQFEGDGRVDPGRVGAERVAMSPDGTYLLITGKDGPPRLWSITTHQWLPFKSQLSLTASAEFDPTSRLVVTSGGGGRIEISDVATGVVVATLGGTQRFITSASFDRSSRRVIAASQDGTVTVWDATPLYQRWASPPIDPECIAFPGLDEDRAFIAVDCGRHGTYVWDTAHDRLVGRLPGATDPRGDFQAASPVVSAAGDRAAIAVGNTVAVYDLPSLQVARTITHADSVTAVAFAPDGHDLISASGDGGVLVTRDGREPLALRSVAGGVDAVGFWPGGRVVVASPGAGPQAVGGRLLVYDAARDALLAEHSVPIRVRAFQMSPNHHRMIMIAAVTTSTPPVLWDVEHDHFVRRLVGHKFGVFSARFVHDGRQILTAGSDGFPRLWDSASGLLEKTFLGTSGYLADAAMSPDGLTVVGGSGTGMLQFWDVASGALVWSLRAHAMAINGLHFEGCDLVTRSVVGEVARWRLPTPPSAAAIQRLLACLPLRLDEATGGLVEQKPCERPAASAAR
jgi:eukaryotic-like serine/threonine-protein kinase